MPAIPKVLYHGTTMLRYSMIKKDGLMNAFVPRFFKRDIENTPGYLYFTTSAEEAAWHGVNTYCVDIRMDQSKFVNKWIYDSFEGSRNIVIIAVKTSHIKQNFEVDPEMETVRKPREDFREVFRAMIHGLDLTGTRQRGAATWIDGSIWWRHKGDIPMKHIMPYRIAPISQFESMMPYLDMVIDRQEMIDLGMTIKDDIRLQQGMERWIHKQRLNLLNSYFKE